MNKQSVFLRKQEQRIAKGVYAILRKQEKELISILEREVKSYERKGIAEDIEEFLENAKNAIPTYLFKSLQYTMQQSYKLAFGQWKNYLPDYKATLSFNIPTEPAVAYLRRMETLHLSQAQGSIYATTQKEILTILREWVSSWVSYTEIAKQIQNTQPFVFSKARAKLIAVQETGQAYWWANFEPAKEMQRQGNVMGKQWATSRDGKVRETHRQNMEQWVIPLDQPWAGTWDIYAPSNDFNCRCTSTYKIIW